MKRNAKNTRKYVQAPMEANEFEYGALGRKGVSPAATIWRVLGFRTKRTAFRYRYVQMCSKASRIADKWLSSSFVVGSAGKKSRNVAENCGMKSMYFD
jgi:hypothetical protein